MDIVGGSAWIDTKYMEYGPHCYFKDKVYASILIKEDIGQQLKQHQKENTFNYIYKNIKLIEQ